MGVIRRSLTAASVVALLVSGAACKASTPASTGSTGSTPATSTSTASAAAPSTSRAATPTVNLQHLKLCSLLTLALARQIVPGAESAATNPDPKSCGYLSAASNVVELRRESGSDFDYWVDKAKTQAGHSGAGRSVPSLGPGAVSFSVDVDQSTVAYTMWHVGNATFFIDGLADGDVGAALARNVQRVSEAVNQRLLR